MKKFIHSIEITALSAIVLAGSLAIARAQEVSIPDPGLNAAIRAALQKPTGPLTEQDLLNLTVLAAESLNISNLQGLEAAHRLTTLDLESNDLTNVSFPSGLTNLSILDLSFNGLTNFVLPGDLAKLTELQLEGNQLTSFSLPAGLTNLEFLGIDENQLTNLALPAGLGGLTELALVSNKLANIALPAGLTNLTLLDLRGNQLTSLALPLDVTALTWLFLDGNPFESLVLSEPLAAGNLTDAIASLKTQNISVFTYPLTPQLVSPQLTANDAFEFVIIGPPGNYLLLSSPDLITWTELAILTNQFGTIRFVDPQPALSGQKYYRARSLP